MRRRAYKTNAKIKIRRKDSKAGGRITNNYCSLFMEDSLVERKVLNLSVTQNRI
jgi:hypothetical protein